MTPDVNLGAARKCLLLGQDETLGSARNMICHSGLRLRRLETTETEMQLQLTSQAFGILRIRARAGLNLTSVFVFALPETRTLLHRTKLYVGCAH